MFVAFERAAVHAARRNRAQVRTLAGVVRVHNASDRVAAVGPGVVLRAGNRTLAPNAVPPNVDTRSQWFRGDGDDWGEAREVPPGETREFPATFFELPGGPDALPDPLVLVVPVALGGGDGGGNADDSFTVEHDVAAYHRGLAGLRSRRTGPADALGVLTVTGELTNLGRFAAIAALRDLGAAGVRRGILTWAPVRLGPPDAKGEPTLVPSVPPLPNAPAEGGRFDPGRIAGISRNQLRGGGSPATPAGLAEFRLATDPTGATGDDGSIDERLAAALAADRSAAVRIARAAGAAGGSGGPAGDFGPTRDDPADAAADVLRSALRNLPPAAAERQIVAGDRLVRPGAVRHAGPNLPPAKLPLLAGLLGDGKETPAVRTAAAAALGAFDDGAARAALAAAVRGGDEPLAAAAAEALATSRFPGGPAELAGVVAGADGTLPRAVFAVLADNPDPAWRDTLVEIAADPAAPARAAALRVLAGAGDPAAPELLRNAVAGDGPAAAAAFALLDENPDPAADRLRAGYVRRVITGATGEGELDAAALAYLAAARPAWAAEPLWDLFARREPGGRAPLIALLARLAGADPPDGEGPGDGGVARGDLAARLAGGWDDLEGDERRAALNVVADLAPDRLPDLAAKAFVSGNQTLETVALAALADAGLPGAVADGALVAALDAAPDREVARRLAERLVLRATPAARAALLARRWSAAPHVAGAARDLAQELHSYGPGRAFFLRAARLVARDDDGDGVSDHRSPADYEATLPLLAAGLAQDPDVASGWSNRAFALGQAGRLEEARGAFRKAQDLDPFDNLALTGLAILEIELGGDLDAAFARAERGLEKYPDDALFAYNLACVYGVAAKARAAEAGVDDPGEDPEAARYLDKALGHAVRSYALSPPDDPDRPGGFRSPGQRNHMANDPDLALLRGDPTFQSLVDGTFEAPDETDGGTGGGTGGEPGSGE